MQRLGYGTLPYKGNMMLKQRREAAQELANRLFETEAAIDVAISKMADLTGYMPVARTNANLSAIVGQAAIAQASHTLSALITARGQIVETHNRLADARDSIGLREMAMGGPTTKPENGDTSDSSKIMSIVDKAA